MAGEIPLRKDISENDKWDLSSLYSSFDEWNADLKKLEKATENASSFAGRIGQSKESLLNVLNTMTEYSMLLEKLYNYAMLNYSAESQCTDNQRLMGLISTAYTKFSAAYSYVDPEILGIKDIETWIEDPVFKDYHQMLFRLIRQKKHTLSPEMEELLAKQGELQNTTSDAFEALTDVDMDFGEIDGKSLSQSTYSSLMQSRDRDVREKTYRQFYEVYKKHAQTLSVLYAGSIKQDVFNARVRGFNTALEASLYSDNVPETVYTGLIDAVHSGFPILHRYYSLRKRLIGVQNLKHYDVYVPTVDVPKKITKYEDAVEIVKKALSPLGKEYVDTLYKGLTTDRWVDKYENKGKRSGAFSCGSFTGNPYILLNYKEDVIGDIFTIAHEGGHSMHSYYSSRNNHYSAHNYTIFEAEVASTFNEQLVARYLIDNANDKKTKAYIISKQLDDIVATLFRQTMFAEYELLCHTQYENGEPLTLESFRNTYRKLLESYFGPEMSFEDISDLEGLRIPHFYRAYYVYKYSTGISAAIALSQKVLSGTQKELNDYIGFLKSGGSKFPIDSLKAAGVDMSTQKPIKDAISRFESLLNEMERLSD